MTPHAHMSRAVRALASARLLLADGDIDGACNRAYYAMFEAAHAALMWAGSAISPSEIKTHRGLITAIGTHLVKPGLVAPEFGKSLNQVERIRLLADYTGEDIDARTAAWAIEQAAAFLEAVRNKFIP